MIEPNYIDRNGQAWITVKGIGSDPDYYDVPAMPRVVAWLSAAQRGHEKGPRPWEVIRTCPDEHSGFCVGVKIRLL